MTLIDSHRFAYGTNKANIKAAMQTRIALCIPPRWRVVKVVVRTAHACDAIIADVYGELRTGLARHAAEFA